MPLAKYENQTFTKKVFVVEECWFVNCVLRECTLVYSGGHYDMQNAQLLNCQWKFREAAQRSFVLLTQIGLIKSQQIPPQLTVNTEQVN